MKKKIHSKFSLIASENGDKLRVGIQKNRQMGFSVWILNKRILNSFLRPKVFVVQKSSEEKLRKAKQIHPRNLSLLGHFAAKELRRRHKCSGETRPDRMSLQLKPQHFQRNEGQKYSIFDQIDVHFNKKKLNPALKWFENLISRNLLKNYRIWARFFVCRGKAGEHCIWLGIANTDFNKLLSIFK